MKILAEINLENTAQEEAILFKTREAVRAVIYDEEGKIALMHVKNGNFYKLPGGGVDFGEDYVSALRRECKEEAGVDVDSFQEVGMIKEIKKEQTMVQNSYCYIVKVIGQKQSLQLTDSEKQNGFSLSWLYIEDAIKLIKDGGYSNLAGQYVSEREFIILSAVKNIA